MILSFSLIRSVKVDLTMLTSSVKVVHRRIRSSGWEGRVNTGVNVGEKKTPRLFQQEELCQAT